MSGLLVKGCTECRLPTPLRRVTTFESQTETEHGIMKRIRHTSRARDNVLHIETDLGIINITVGLHDSQGRRVEHISVISDGDRFLPKRVIQEGDRLIEIEG